MPVQKKKKKKNYAFKVGAHMRIHHLKRTLL